MKIFISWSGSSEQAVAEALQSTLTELCASDVEVFVSSRSISKGANGIAVIEANLDSSAFGIVLVSKKNQSAAWLNYEAGWLASTLDRPVATICLDLRPSDITSPLAPRQATQFSDPADMETLLREIVRVANPSMNDRTFATLLASVWPTIRDSWKPRDGDGETTDPRSERDMLSELVERVRAIEAQQLADATSPMFDRAIAARYPSNSFKAKERRRSMEVAHASAARLTQLVDEASAGNVSLIEFGETDGNIYAVLSSKADAAPADREAAVRALRRRYPESKMRITFGQESAKRGIFETEGIRAYEPHEP
ncbi:hypothetical protein BIV03_00975 [Curtobacterium sp. MCBA15_016]|uniref:TIR domain-containing protein n=1 Tax=Curtobacterium sp. MCBA15_016 TaxID=1898740 RepID=UPI0008DD942C|nr:TIR domain-containing protein [Curtobacterium sp. MCBA15_016]OII28856.1 hypothetical protein BIV03_00975 [Curtobacterium sp. MCBA15_016]